MQIALVAATRFEIEPFLSTFQIKAATMRNPSVIFEKHIVDIIITGIGMVATSYHLGKTFSKMNYDLAINAGIAGSFRHDIPLGSLVNVMHETFSEIGAETEDDFLLPEQIGFKEFNNFPFTKGNLINQTEINSPLIQSLPKVKGITANTIHGNPQHIAQIHQRFHPDVETMEGAAFMYACMLENIPFFQLRSISNYVEARNKANWEVEKAIQSLNHFLISFFNE
ncbi:MAG: futalosine hydrolase [Bacteroidota bacterium]